MKKRDNFGLGFIAVILLTIAVIACVKAAVIWVFWNYIIVDTLGVDIQHISFGVAFIISIFLGIIFGGSVKSRGDN